MRRSTRRREHKRPGISELKSCHVGGGPGRGHELHLSGGGHVGRAHRLLETHCCRIPNRGVTRCLKMGRVREGDPHVSAEGVGSSNAEAETSGHRHDCHPGRVSTTWRDRPRRELDHGVHRVVGRFMPHDDGASGSSEERNRRVTRRRAALLENPDPVSRDRRSLTYLCCRICQRDDECVAAARRHQQDRETYLA